MFSEDCPPLPWDKKNNYTREAIELYYEVNCSLLFIFDRVRFDFCVLAVILWCETYNNLVIIWLVRFNNFVIKISSLWFLNVHATEFLMVLEL